MLQRCESTSDMYSTTSFLRGGSARPNRAATMFTAWCLSTSSCITVKGLTSPIFLTPVGWRTSKGSLLVLLPLGPLSPSWLLSNTPTVRTVAGSNTSQDSKLEDANWGLPELFSSGAKITAVMSGLVKNMVASIEAQSEVKSAREFVLF
nr:hypothetical protein C5167_001545 [Ipomoea batatas]